MLRVSLTISFSAVVFVGMILVVEGFSNETIKNKVYIPINLWNRRVLLIANNFTSIQLVFGEVELVVS